MDWLYFSGSNDYVFSNNGGITSHNKQTYSFKIRAFHTEATAFQRMAATQIDFVLLPRFAYACFNGVYGGREHLILNCGQSSSYFRSLTFHTRLISYRLFLLYQKNWQGVTYYECSPYYFISFSYVCSKDARYF